LFVRNFCRIKSWAKGFTNKVTGRSTRSSSWYASSRVGFNMSIDPPVIPQSDRPLVSIFFRCTPEDSPHGISPCLERLSRKEYLQQAQEQEIHTHTLVLDEVFLCEAGMASGLDTIFQFVGWSSIATITELGSRLLTIEFLCTLKLTETGIYFRLFTQKFCFT